MGEVYDGHEGTQDLNQRDQIHRCQVFDCELMARDRGILASAVLLPDALFVLLKLLVDLFCQMRGNDLVRITGFCDS